MVVVNPHRRDSVHIFPEGKYKYVIMFMDAPKIISVEWIHQYRQASGDEANVITLSYLYLVIAVIMFSHTTFFSTLHDLCVFAEKSLSVPTFQKIRYVISHWFA